MGKVTYSTLSNMWSIITDDLDVCYECQRKAEDCHHIFEGPDKRWSQKYGLMIPMCHMCHMELHSNQEMNDWYKKLGQAVFQEKHPDIIFNHIFRRNYL